MHCTYFRSRFASAEWGSDEVALPDDVPGGADAAMLVLRFCYDFDAVAEAVAVGGCGLPALAVAADFFGCDTLNRLASEAFAAELEGADVHQRARLAVRPACTIPAAAAHSPEETRPSG